MPKNVHWGLCFVQRSLRGFFMSVMYSKLPSLFSGSVICPVWLTAADTAGWAHINWHVKKKNKNFKTSLFFFSYIIIFLWFEEQHTLERFHKWPFFSVSVLHQRVDVCSSTKLWTIWFILGFWKSPSLKRNAQSLMRSFIELLLSYLF